MLFGREVLQGIAEGRVTLAKLRASIARRGDAAPH
jgi:hypothetical protein